ncbi:MAG: Putative metal ABC transport system permease protein [Clostridiales bacterium 38_11]|nr:MAG: Putative metal ABC transport system permease protein [Clostridiales bacterium 38_11]
MKNKRAVIALSFISLFAFTVLNLSIGAVNVNFKDIIQIILERLGVIPFQNSISESTKYIILDVRLPRIIASYFVGGTLAISGVAYQGLLKNPMADPYILGISSGAAFGATISIVFFGGIKILGIASINLTAFIGAVLVVFIVYNIARIGNDVPITTLLLSGIAMSQFLAALMAVMMLMYGESLHIIIHWTMGSLSGKGWDKVFSLIPYSLAGLAVLLYLSRDMDLMLLGDENANNLGVNSERVKKTILFTTSIITGAAVAISGIIGFVGLIVPHAVRIFTGPRHKVLLPVSFNAGGILLMFCDTLARSVITQEIPVGIVTAILGGPFFLFLLYKKKREVL